MYTQEARTHLATEQKWWRKAIRYYNGTVKWIESYHGHMAESYHHQLSTTTNVLIQPQYHTVHIPLALNKDWAIQTVKMTINVCLARKSSVTKLLLEYKPLHSAHTSRHIFKQCSPICKSETMQPKISMLMYKPRHNGAQTLNICSNVPHFTNAVNQNYNAPKNIGEVAPFPNVLHQLASSASMRLRPLERSCIRQLIIKVNQRDSH